MIQSPVRALGPVSLRPIEQTRLDGILSAPMENDHSPSPPDSGSRRHRYRIRFAKTVAMRFTSHLDLQRTWERTLRRAGLSPLYSQGFTPRPRLHLGAALPLGYTSEEDLAEVWLQEERAPADTLSLLQRAAPPGLRVLDVVSVPAEEPPIQQQIVAALYEVRLEAPVDLGGLRTGAEKLMAEPSLPRSRRGKDYDLRPLLLSLEAVLDSSGAPCLRMRLAAREGATGRPEEVLLALGLDPHLARIARTRLILASEPPPEDAL